MSFRSSGKIVAGQLRYIPLFRFQGGIAPSPTESFASFYVVNRDVKTIVPRSWTILSAPNPSVTVSQA